MLRNLVDLDRAIASLKHEGSSPAMQIKARANLARPARTSRPRLAIAMAAIAAGTILLWPHGSSGMAWAQVVKNSVGAPNVHSVARYKNGAISLEQWTQGEKQAWVLYGPEGKVVNEIHGDRERMYRYFHFTGTTVKKNPNRRPFADLYTRKPGEPSLMMQIGGSLEQLLQNSSYKVVKQSNMKVDGDDATAFELELSKPYLDNFIAVVKNKTGLISEIRRGGGQLVHKIDYPDSIPSDVFEPRPERVKNVEVYDRDKLEATIKKRVNQGLQSDKGVTVCLVALDYSGTLWVIWSGQPVDGQMLKPFTANGLPLGKPYGHRRFTSSAGSAPDQPIFTAKGSRLYGMGREVKVLVGQKIDLEIPTSKGIARFKGLPVLRFGMPMSYIPWHQIKDGKPFG